MTEPNPARALGEAFAERYYETRQRVSDAHPYTPRDVIDALTFAEMVGPTGHLDVRFPGPAGQPEQTFVVDLRVGSGTSGLYGPFASTQAGDKWASDTIGAGSGSWTVRPVHPAAQSDPEPPREVAVALPVAYRLTRTCDACPTQYDIDVEDGGAYAYFRYRSGYASLHLWPTKQARTVMPALAEWEEKLGDDLDGSMEEEQVIDLVNAHLPRLVAEARANGSPIARRVRDALGLTPWVRL